LTKSFAKLLFVVGTNEATNYSSLRKTAIVIGSHFVSVDRKKGKQI